MARVVRCWLVQVGSDVPIDRPTAHRDALAASPEARGIQASPEYKLPIHLNRPYAERFGFRRGQFPVSERVANETLVLPNWPGLTRADLEYVVDAMAESYRSR